MVFLKYMNSFWASEKKEELRTKIYFKQSQKGGQKESPFIITRSYSFPPFIFNKYTEPLKESRS